MLIAGAKGFAKELLGVIFQINSTSEIFFLIMYHVGCRKQECYSRGHSCRCTRQTFK